MSTNTIPGSQRRILLIVKIFSQSFGLLRLPPNRVYESGKPRREKNGKQRNESGTAPFKEMRVNPQSEKGCLTGVDVFIYGELDVSPQNTVTNWLSL